MTINKKKEEPIEDIEYNVVNDNKNYHSLIIINGFLHNYKFNFDIKFNERMPVLSGKSWNKNRPKSFIVYFSEKVRRYIKDEKKFTVDLNNIASNINLDFNISSIQTKIIKL